MVRRLLVLLLLLCFFPASAQAHERRVYEINGKQYLLVIGSLDEPVHTGDKSGIDFRVRLADPANPGDSFSPKAVPVEGIEKSLQAEVLVGGKAYPVSFSPVFRQPGDYEAVFYPQETLPYLYRIFGTIDGVDFDQTYSCNSEGHAMHGQEHAMVMEVSPGVKQLLSAGGFGCPKDRNEVSFPQVNTTGNPALLVSVLALLLSSFAVWQTRRK